MISPVSLCAAALLDATDARALFTATVTGTVRSGSIRPGRKRLLDVCAEDICAGRPDVQCI